MCAKYLQGRIVHIFRCRVRVLMILFVLLSRLWVGVSLLLSWMEGGPDRLAMSKRLIDRVGGRSMFNENLLICFQSLVYEAT
jgi:hypothetical protein